MHPSRPQTPVCFARVHASSQVPFRKSCLLFATPLLSRRLGRIQPLTRRSGTSAPSPRRALGRSSCHEDIKFLTESATLLGNGSVKQPSARERERKEDENREMNAGSSCKAGRGLRTHWHRSPVELIATPMSLRMYPRRKWETLFTGTLSTAWCEMCLWVS